MSIVSYIRRLNIFILGLVAFLILMAYWIVPNVVIDLGQAGLTVIAQHKAIFWTFAGGLAAIFIWIIYLRYLLAKKSIESRTEVQKYRLQLEMTASRAHLPQLDYLPSDSEDLKTIEGALENQSSKSIPV